MKKIYFIAICIVLLTAFVTTFHEYIFVTQDNYSGNVISFLESNDEKFIAIKTEKNAGATTPFIYRLIILEKGEDLNDHSPEVFRTYSDFDYQWKGDNLLVNVPMDYSHSKYIFLQEKKWRDINIEYHIIKE